MAKMDALWVACLFVCFAFGAVRGDLGLNYGPTDPSANTLQSGVKLTRGSPFDRTKRLWYTSTPSGTNNGKSEGDALALEASSGDIFANTGGLLSMGTSPPPFAGVIPNPGTQGVPGVGDAQRLADGGTQTPPLGISSGPAPSSGGSGQVVSVEELLSKWRELSARSTTGSPPTGSALPEANLRPALDKYPLP